MGRLGAGIALGMLFAAAGCRLAPLPPSPHEGMHSITLSRSYVPPNGAALERDSDSCRPRCELAGDGEAAGELAAAWTSDIGFGLGMLWRRRVRTYVGFEMGAGTMKGSPGEDSRTLGMVTPHVAVGVRTYHGGFKLDTDMYLGPRILRIEHDDETAINRVSMSARPRLSIMKRIGRYTFGLYVEADLFLPGPNAAFGIRLDGEPPFASPSY